MILQLGKLSRPIRQADHFAVDALGIGDFAVAVRLYAAAGTVREPLGTVFGTHERGGGQPAHIARTTPGEQFLEQPLVVRLLPVGVDELSGWLRDGGAI